ncbi:AMP-binding protein [Streptomyces sp. ARC12]|uniref:AMP-binding protein n=1 Tax=Streptomyces sp. ARC12 TaxID=2724151 RepID=UPI003857CB7E
MCHPPCRPSAGPGDVRGPAAAYPHAPAALWHDRKLTYEELGAAADRLANQLFRTGSSGRPVGILMDRCLDMTVAGPDRTRASRSTSSTLPLQPARTSRPSRHRCLSARCRTYRATSLSGTAAGR